MYAFKCRAREDVLVPSKQLLSQVGLTSIDTRASVVSSSDSLLSTPTTFDYFRVAVSYSLSEKDSWSGIGVALAPDLRLVRQSVRRQVNIEEKVEEV